VTLILANANLIGVNMVSDRLLSMGAAGSTVDFDREANKNVVFAARDGVVAIGYSGQAYIGPNTTDQWIANVCRGELGASTTQHEGVSPEPLPEWLDIGIVARRLRDYLNAQPFQQRFTGMPFEVVLAGIRQNARSKWRYPFLITISNDHGRRDFQLESETRRNMWVPTVVVEGQPTSYERYLRGDLNREHRLQAYSAIVAAGGLSPQRMLALHHRLIAAGVEDVESLLVEEIRAVAAIRTGVGRDCMGIAISRHPAHPFAVRVRYLPATHTRVAVSIEDARMSMSYGEGSVRAYRRVAYTPWFIGRRMTAAPQRMTSRGFMHLRIGRVPVVFEMPPDPGPPTNIIFASNTQRRPPRP
jgi:hypothetical protein